MKGESILSSPKSYEDQLLTPVNDLINKIALQNNNLTFEFRVQLLESVSSRLGAFSLSEFHKLFGIAPVASYKLLDLYGKDVLALLSTIPVHPALLLSALAREPLSTSEQRSAGAYYTDFRLAQHLAEIAKPALKEKAKVIDPACGSGILLAAVSISVCGADRKKASEWLSNSVYANDLSPIALRGARLALASLTNDLKAISKMWSNWSVQDSLLAPIDVWKGMSSSLFDLVIGNPPWEKVKLTRHEYLNANGSDRHYGQEYEDLNTGDFLEKRNEIQSYAQKLKDLYDFSSEPDLYMAFLALFNRILAPEGRVAILVPAGLIRSQGTESLRRDLLSSGSEITITVMENRARFFSIDTRFKFLSLSYSKKTQSKFDDPILLHHATGTPSGVLLTGEANIDRSILEQVRKDLSIPEVRNSSEWDIFVSMSRNGVDWSDSNSSWYPEFCREVDMTHARAKFQKKGSNTALPVVEGRMVQAYHFGAKKYISGSGRKAIWEPVPKGRYIINPQFWLEESFLSNKATERSRMNRIGFCDIAGQTNERSMMATIIPSSVVCGNKVPTILFPNDRSESRLFLCLGILNSIPFDWMLRRNLTTTVNYFLLQGLPFPRIEPSDLPGRYIINAVKAVLNLGLSIEQYDPWKNAELRAMIDISVIVAYGLGFKELELMLEDFPLLDRGQPALPAEEQSTITKDYLLLCAAKRFNLPLTNISDRVDRARKIGAVPYIPSEMSGTIKNSLEAIQND